MYDITGNVITNNDLQNKAASCAHGEKNLFVKIMVIV